ncbi:MAG: hypothetical protein ACRD9Q_03870 [Nitrososphaeraceae archaeon]
MGQIRKKETCGIIDAEEENEAISYCQRCLKFNVYSILQERIYLPDEVTNEHDRENWKQCHNCGQIVPIYAAKKESKLQDFVELSSNPFEQDKSILGLGNKKPKSSYERQRQKLLEGIEKEKDEDIKRELRKGNLVEVIED